MEINLSNLPQGAIGQLRGPFSSNDVINFGINHLIKFSITANNKDFMKLSTESFDGYDITGDYLESSFDNELHTFINGRKDPLLQFRINNQQTIAIRYNRTYESDIGINVQTISFPNGAPASTSIEYVVLEI